MAIGYGSDISSETLGKYGLDEATDHPETFPEMVDFVKTIAVDPQFWKKFVRNAIDWNTAPVVAKRNFESYFQLLPEQERAQLWETVTTERLTFTPTEMVDTFIRAGSLEWLVTQYLKSNYSNPNESLNSQPHAAYGSWTDYAPESSRRLNDLLIRYKAEPLVLSRSFLRGVNPKEGPINNYGFEPYDARLAGHDAFIHRNGVGGGVADEVIIFEAEDIWTVSKQPLSHKVYESNHKKYQP